MKQGLLLFCCLCSLVLKAQWAYKGLNGVQTNQLTLEGDTVYASTTNGLYCKYLHTTDTLWRHIGLFGKNVVNTLFTGGNSCISLAEVSTGRTQIHRSFDRGRTFTLLLPDTSELYNYSWNQHMAKSPHDHDTIYFLHHGIKTFDGGLTWQPLNFTDQINKFIYVAPDNPAEVYAGGENFFLQAYSMQSADGAQTWNYMDNSSFFAGDNAIHVMYVNGNDMYAAGEGVINHRLRSGGPWTRLFESATITSAWALYYYGLSLSPVNPHYLYASGAGHTPSTHAVRLLVSGDKGASWDSVSFDPGVRTLYHIFDVKTHHYMGHDITWLGGTGVYTYTQAVPVSVNETGDAMNIGLYPNPANDQLQLQYTGKNVYKLMITDVHGQTVYTAREVLPGMVIPVKHLTPGLYHCILYGENGSTGKKFVKQ